MCRAMTGGLGKCSRLDLQTAENEGTGIVSSGTERLTKVKAPWKSGVVGLGIIVTAFVISIINASLETPNMFVSMTLQPFIFVGLGLLLYHIGVHVHAIHQNVILMADDMGDH
jgi:hypothetical protein